MLPTCLTESDPFCCVCHQLWDGHEWLTEVHVEENNQRESGEPGCRGFKLRTISIRDDRKVKETHDSVREAVPVDYEEVKSFQVEAQ